MKTARRKFHQDQLVATLKRIRGLRTAVLSGLFTAQPQLECDVLLVGKISQNSLEKFSRGAEKLMGQEINYAVMDPQEYEYRRNTFDRFTKDIFENEHLVLIDKN